MEYEFTDTDLLASWKEEQIGNEGMKIDRMLFQNFETGVKNDTEIAEEMHAGNIDAAIGLTLNKYIDKPSDYITLEKLRKSLKIDRQITMRELLEMIFYGNVIKGKDELLNDEFEKFMANVDVNDITDLSALRYFFLAYITDENLRRIIDQNDFAELYHNPTFNIEDFSRVDDNMKIKMPYYIKTYVPLQKFAS